MERDELTFWLHRLPREEVLPPFCVEIVMKDRRSYYVHSGGFNQNGSEDLTLRVWDLRAFSPKDLEELRDRLNEIKSRDELAQERKVHPKLDWAVLRAGVGDVLYCVEWHDRLWPQEERPPIGFGKSSPT